LVRQLVIAPRRAASSVGAWDIRPRIGLPRRRTAASAARGVIATVVATSATKTIPFKTLGRHLHNSNCPWPRNATALLI